MKFLTKSGLIGCMLASGSLFAVEPAMGWYAGFFLGPSIASGTDITIQNPPFFIGTAPATADISYKVLGNFGAQLGYRCNKFRYEGELVFNRNNIKEITVNGITFNNNANISTATSAKGNTSMGAAFFNAYYEFYDEDYADTTFVPYFGLGIGYTHVKNTIKFTTPGLLNTGIEFQNTASGNAAIGQAILGFSYFFSDSMSLGSDLRYMKSQSINDFNSGISVGSWNFIMNFSFDTPY